MFIIPTRSRSTVARKLLRVIARGSLCDYAHVRIRCSKLWSKLEVILENVELGAVKPQPFTVEEKNMENHPSTVICELCRLKNWDPAKHALASIRVTNELTKEEFRRVAQEVSLFYLLAQEDFRAR